LQLFASPESNKINYNWILWFIFCTSFVPEYP
jgi:hypothetical protein